MVTVLLLESTRHLLLLFVPGVHGWALFTPETLVSIEGLFSLTVRDRLLDPFLISSQLPRASHLADDFLVQQQFHLFPPVVAYSINLQLEYLTLPQVVLDIGVLQLPDLYVDFAYLFQGGNGFLHVHVNVCLVPVPVPVLHLILSLVLPPFNSNTTAPSLTLSLFTS